MVGQNMCMITMQFLKKCNICSNATKNPQKTKSISVWFWQVMTPTRWQMWKMQFLQSKMEKFLMRFTDTWQQIDLNLLTHWSQLFNSHTEPTSCSPLHQINSPCFLKDKTTQCSSSLKRIPLHLSCVTQIHMQPHRYQCVILNPVYPLGKTNTSK